MLNSSYFIVFELDVVHSETVIENIRQEFRIFVHGWGPPKMCRLQMVDTLGCESLTYGQSESALAPEAFNCNVGSCAAGYMGAQKASLARSSANPSNSSCRNGTHSLSVPIASFLLSTI